MDQVNLTTHLLFTLIVTKETNKLKSFLFDEQIKLLF